jgi:hypothetical protein
VSPHQLTALQEWCLDPTRLVGFYPFHFDDHGGDEASVSGSGLQPASRGGPYSMLSDRAVFVHSLILRSIPKIPQECQHLGLSIIVSSMTSKPPVAVLSKPQSFHLKKSTRPVQKPTSLACLQWIESIGATNLPDQISTIVGQEKHL